MLKIWVSKTQRSLPRRRVLCSIEFFAEGRPLGTRSESSGRTSHRSEPLKTRPDPRLLVESTRESADRAFAADVRVPGAPAAGVFIEPTTSLSVRNAIVLVGGGKGEVSQRRRAKGIGFLRAVSRRAERVVGHAMNCSL